MFLDAQGNSTMEKSNDIKGTVNIVGGMSKLDENIIIDERILPASAKTVIHRNQFRKRFQAREEDFEEDVEEDENYESSPPSKTGHLGDYFPSIHLDSTK